MSAPRIDPVAPKTVTFRPDAGSPGYGTLSLSWERDARKQLITLSAARKVAEGWQATFSVEAAW